MLASFQVQLEPQGRVGESESPQQWSQKDPESSDEGAIPDLALSPSQEAQAEVRKTRRRQGRCDGQEPVAAEDLSAAALHPGAGQALWLQIRGQASLGQARLLH